MYGKPDHQRFWEKCTTKISSNTANVFQSREIFDTGKSIVVVAQYFHCRFDFYLRQNNRNEMVLVPNSYESCLVAIVCGKPERKRGETIVYCFFTYCFCDVAFYTLIDERLHPFVKASWNQTREEIGHFSTLPSNRYWCPFLKRISHRLSSHFEELPNAVGSDV